MTVIATEGQYTRFSSLVKWLDAPEKPELFKDVLTMNDAVATLTLGTVLGKVTTTGKFKVCLQTATDGSNTPAALYIGDAFGATADTTLVAATDTKVLALVRGKAVVAKDALKLDSSFGTAAQKQTAYDALKAIGILAESAT